MTGIDRRRFLGLAVGLVPALRWGIGGGAAASAGSPPAPALAEVVSRARWGGDLPVTGPLEVEAAADVRFLLVHHTAGSNTYTPDAVPDILRGIYRFHTGPKQWPDVAYNFFVDRYGTVWEGRTGSLADPVKGSATGGSQGFALLCCFVGDHSVEQPPPPAVESMTRLLAGLADRYGIDTAPGATASFESRGSNLWPAGQRVVTPTIAGHRDMSVTACPGDAGYALVTDHFPAAVTAARAARPADPAPAEQAPRDPAPAEGAPADPAPTEGEPADEAPAAVAEDAPPTPPHREAALPSQDPPDADGSAGRRILAPLGAVAGALGAAGAAGGAVIRGRRRRPSPPPQTGPEGP